MARNLEFIYVSLDLADKQYTAHLADLGSWMSIPFGDTRSDIIKKKYKINSVPQVIIISPRSGKTVTATARQDIFMNQSDEGIDAVFRGWLDKMDKMESML